MASNLPDPDLSTLTSSSQIFSATAGTPSYTLPQIRSLHKHIHVAIDDKQARLRTQVGGSYRELLGTADAIVRMRAEVDEAQGVLGRMGARCGRAVVGGKVAGLGRFAAERDGVHEDRFGRRSSGDAARVKILAGCVLVLGGLLQGRAGLQDGDRLVTATKVLVLGSLLVKSFEHDKPGFEVKAALGTSSKSLEKLRKRLLRSIDRVLETVGENTSRDLLLKALCAHSLATGTGTRDVIRHFLDVRGNAMASVFDVEEHRSSMDVVKGLELYTKTILDVQYLVPNKLTEALSSLKKETLLSDASLRNLESLRLDIYERWCGDDISEYKPSIQHNDLDGKQAVEMLTKWSAKGSEVLLQGLEKTLERTTEFKAITELRTEVLQLWIRDGGKARGSDPSVMLGKLRQTINAHVAGVLDGKVHKLRLVGSEVGATLDVWRAAGVTDSQPSLWDTASLDMELHHGAGPFALDVVNRLYGRNDAVARAVTGYKSWAQVIDDVEGVVEQLKRQRWDNDVDEVEDEETIDERQRALSRDDPAKLQERLHGALEKAFRDLDEHLSKLWDANKEGENGGRVAMYLLRILRDIRARLPKLESVKGFGLGMVPSLQEATAATVAAAPVESFADGGLAKRKVVGRSLWEGDPELPTSPSPSVFRLLRDLTVAMGDAGTDLWSPAAVAVLRRHVSKELSGRWAAALEAHLSEGEGKPGDGKSAAEADGSKAGGDVKTDTAEGTEDKAEDKTSTDSAEESKTEKEDGEEAADNSATDEKAEAAGDTTPAKEEAAEESTIEKGAEAIAESKVAEKLRRDLLVQWLFDIAVLRLSISTAETSDGFKELEAAVWKKTDLEGTSAQQRLGKASQEYWKRTSLLFGLLS